MEPIIYTLPKIDKSIEISELNIYFDDQASPKLMKFGFNNINEQLDLIKLTSIPYYKTGLDFDFDREDENGIYFKASAQLKTDEFDLEFAEFWEILNIFGLLNNNQNIYTTHPKTIKNIISVYQNYTNSKIIYNVIEKETKKSAKTTKTTANLTINKYSNIDIDENAAIQFIINDLPDLFNIQNENSNMILQLFNMQTKTTAEIINYLTSLYNEAYLMKPTVTSDLSDNKYLILLGLKKTQNFTIPLHPENIYLASLGIKQISNDLVTIIQCMNSDIIPKKYKKYNKIKKYLDTKVYEGATYQEMLNTQNENAKKWLETFLNFDKMKSLLDQTIQKSKDKCSTYAQLVNLLNQ